MVEALQEPYTITRGDSDVTETDSGQTSASVYGTIWSYHVPTGLGLIILPGHTFACYLYDTENAEAPNTNLIKIVLLDSSKQDEKAIAGPFMYAVCKTFDDRDKMFRLNVASPVKVYEKQYIEIKVTGDGSYSVDALSGPAYCYFELAIARVRQPL